MKGLALGHCIAAVLFGLLCFSLSGCAGGASSTTTPGPTPTPTPGPGPSPTPTPSPTPSPAAHSISLSWLSSSSPNIIAYNIYRATVSHGPFTRVGNVAGTSFTDSGVQSGQTYFYEVTAIDNTNTESAPTAPVSAAVP